MRNQDYYTYYHQNDHPNNNKGYYFTTKVMNKEHQLYAISVVIQGTIKYILLYTISMAKVLSDLTCLGGGASAIVDGANFCLYAKAYSEDAPLESRSKLDSIITFDESKISRDIFEIKNGIIRGDDGLASCKVESSQYYLSYGRLSEDNHWNLVLIFSRDYYIGIYGNLVSGLNVLVIIVVLFLIGLFLFIFLKDKKEGKMIYALSYVDILTGGYNYKSFCVEADRLIDKNKSKNLYCMEININNFKLINEIYGHSFGDEILCKVYDIIKNAIGEDDICCRKWDDAYAVLAAYETYEETIAGINLICDRISVLLIEHDYIVLPSIGVYEITDPSISIRTMCDCANVALRTVKGNVERSYAFYNKEMSEKISE